MTRVTRITKRVDRGHYDCQECMDTGEIWDEQDKRKRPCPYCPAGRHKY